MNERTRERRAGYRNVLISAANAPSPLGYQQHEIDYILFARKSSVSLSLNPEEVSDIKWVTKGEVRRMAVARRAWAC